MTLPAGVTLWKPNPNPVRITDEMWWLAGELIKLAPGSQLGGIYADKPGYHNSILANRAKWPNNYSIRDAIDNNAPLLTVSAAIDWTFPEAQGATPDYSRINSYSLRLEMSGKDPNDHRLDNWREYFGCIHGGNNEGYDFRYDFDVSSDDSHDWHIHGSVARAYVDSFLTMMSFLSVCKGETVGQWKEHLMTQPTPQQINLKALVQTDGVISAREGTFDPAQPNGATNNKFWWWETYIREADRMITSLHTGKSTELIKAIVDAVKAELGVDPTEAFADKAYDTFMSDIREIVRQEVLSVLTSYNAGASKGLFALTQEVKEIPPQRVY